MAMKIQVNRRTETPKILDRKSKISIMSNIRLTIQQQLIKMPQASKTRKFMPLPRFFSRISSVTLIKTGMISKKGREYMTLIVNRKKTQERKKTTCLAIL